MLFYDVLGQNVNEINSVFPAGCCLIVLVVIDVRLDAILRCIREKRKRNKLLFQYCF